MHTALHARTRLRIKRPRSSLLRHSPNPFPAAAAAEEDGEPAPAISGARAAAPHAPSPPHRARLRPRRLPLLLPVLPARRQLLVNPSTPPPSSLHRLLPEPPRTRAFAVYQARAAHHAGELGRQHRAGEESLRGGAVRQVHEDARFRDPPPHPCRRPHSLRALAQGGGHPHPGPERHHQGQRHHPDR
jgi:hypothetical protein